jgi:hypothetical protein
MRPWFALFSNLQKYTLFFIPQKLFCRKRHRHSLFFIVSGGGYLFALLESDSGDNKLTTAEVSNMYGDSKNKR